MKRASRTPSNLSESLHRQLNSYALAASAAGVAALAIAPAVEAKVIYIPAHIVLHFGDRFNLDLN